MSDEELKPIDNLDEPIDEEADEIEGEEEEEEEEEEEGTRTVKVTMTVTVPMSFSVRDVQESLRSTALDDLGEGTVEEVEVEEVATTK